MTKKHFLLLFLFTLMGGILRAQDTLQSFGSTTLVPTVAWIRYHGETRRMARLVFHGGKAYHGGLLMVAFNQQRDTLTIPSDRNGLDAYEVPLPGGEITVPTQVTVRLRSEGQTFVARGIVKPARKNWTVYVLPHSHVDIGYTNTQDKVLKLHMDNIDESIALAEKTEHYPEGARFKWTTEAIWVVDNYLRLSSPEKRARFWNAVKNGWINLDGAYANINTSLTDSWQLTEMFAEAQRLAKAHGIEIHTMFQGDVPGASWGLAAQVRQTGIRYFLSGPNASDRIGNLAKWQDRPFYWLSPSGKEKLLFWQCQPYSIGYALKGSKIPNFFSVEDPKPYYTGNPSKYFLNPYLFKYLGDLEARKFPYDMTILTWAMSDNAPIDPELPDAVKAWNAHFESPKLVITSVKQFFHDFEAKYKDQIPSFTGDYTEYWTDGVASAARETAKNRKASDVLKQASAIWAIRGNSPYPAPAFNDTWKDLLLFNEHTWGAYNSVSDPDDPKVKSEWAYKQTFALRAEKMADSLLAQSLASAAASTRAIDVYNTTNWPRTDVVYVPAALSVAGDLVRDAQGKKIPSQRLTTGELAFVATAVPALGKSTYTINRGSAYVGTEAMVNDSLLSNGIYTVILDPENGDITQLIKGGRNYVSDTAGLNHYIYLPGDTLKYEQGVSRVRLHVKEKGPLVVSLVASSDAAGANHLSREVRLVSGVDEVEIIDQLDKKAIRRKEAVHFAFPFKLSNPQVRYSIPWGSATVEADQLAYANHNWYTMQRWVDISNADYGITWSSPDAPLFEVGGITTAGLLGGLHDSPQWITFTPQSSNINSWVMNNLWHTNFRADQEGKTTFRYFIQVHAGGFNSFDVNKTGLDNHQPLRVAPADGKKEAGLSFAIHAPKVYVEQIKPSDDGKAKIITLVNSSKAKSQVSVVPRGHSSLKLWESNVTEDKLRALDLSFTLPAKEIITLRIENEAFR